MSKKVLLLVWMAALCIHQQLLAQKKNSFWSAVSNSAWQRSEMTDNQPVFVPQAHKTFRLAEDALRQSLMTAPAAKNVAIKNSPFIISIPNAKGETERFKIVESPVMSAALAAKYPQLKSYAGQGIDDPSATIRFDITPKGFHAMILSGTRKAIYINPADKSKGLYVVFDRDTLAEHTTAFTCAVKKGATAQKQNTVTGKNADDNILRTYRFAVTVGGQFSQLCLNGTETTDAEKKLSVLSTLVTDLTRINGIFERDFNVHLNYVDNEDTIIFLDSKSDPFDDNTATGYDNGKWNIQCKKTLDKYIGNSNYDCGHLLMGMNTGGNAGCIGCVCDSATKGTAVTGYNQVAGDPFVVDFWAHEIGHQFGATHTFDYEDEGTGAQVEPGSGSTIMGYAGTTGATDVQPNSDDYFHAVSIQQVTDYIKSIDGQPGPVLQRTNNHTPTADAAADYVIPAATPFILTGNAADMDAADVLSYTWEQMDALTKGYNEYPKPTSTAGPVFRSFAYSSSKSRTFPVIDTILSGKTKWKWEALPAVSRDLHFRFTVRDNHAGGGSNNSDDMKVTVDSTAGPFVVTGLDSATSWKGNSQVAITWNVANTTNVRIKCSSVSIQLSTDGGYTFPITLAANTPNDGSETVLVPNQAISKGRIRVKAANNIFFDISNADLSVTPIVIPIAWLSFSANKSPGGVLLQWTTANETNSSFAVERSSDSIHYTTIGTVAAGNQLYSFEDVMPVAGVNYYRIRQVDDNNNSHYSSIAAIDISNVLAVAVYPNPVRNVVNIRLNQNAVHAAIVLTDAAGRIVYTTTAALVTAGEVIQVPAARLAAGVYIIKVKWDKGSFTQQLLVN
ncbi:T9SS type A sorting domain-containing protein [Ilyomonas limi]|uniref:T9SS type A sorting domain-containing protein n=1 Tax=Ilyomonas limi TaxID=2575867 RepID=A0A4U3KVV0_9BACT|nr:zinc-dependent metalloprotease [Ilyomonas limi]TKK66651.1 T9SS type A sorting domain-containing protein [Ilyomonas limi]